MAANRGIDNFSELRIAAEGMREAADAILGFLDDQGIAIGKRSYKRLAVATNGNGDGHAPSKNLDTLREKVKAHYAAKRGGGGKKKRKINRPPANVPDPDGKHVTFLEAAKILKMSEANVRLMTADGRLPKTTFESRPWSKKFPDRRRPMQVLLHDDVKRYAAELKKTASA